MPQNRARHEAAGPEGFGKPAPARDTYPSIEVMDVRRLSLIRLILALSALVIIYIDPSEPDRFVAVTYGALVLYSLYSAAILVCSFKYGEFFPLRVLNWIDVGWYLAIISLSSGTSSIFFFFFFFPILVASFRFGLSEGLRVTVASAVLFTLFGYLTAPHAPGFELNRFLLRPVYMLVLGYMMARMGGSEVTLRRRLSLLQNVSRLSNPRFGVDQTIGSLLTRLREFYDADSCLLVMSEPDARGHTLRRADRRRPEQAVVAEPLPRVLDEILLALPADLSVVFRKRARSRLLGRAKPGFYALPRTRAAAPSGDVEACAEIADTLDAESFVSVPLAYREAAVGRLFITSRRGAFDRSEAEFLARLAEQVAPVIETIRLLDRLASEAAEQERQKISRDLHDGTIQPYIGFKMGLQALRRQAEAAPALAREIEELIAMADESINDLRHYLAGLKGSRTEQREAALVIAVRRQASKFSDFYGIDITVDAPSDLHINDRLAAEVFLMVSEGLSNIRRHTGSRTAVVQMRRSGDQFILCLRNETPADAARADFVPRSLTERARSLGGEAHVERQNGYTDVYVKIPV